MRVCVKCNNASENDDIEKCPLCGGEVIDPKYPYKIKSEDKGDAIQFTVTQYVKNKN